MAVGWDEVDGLCNPRSSRAVHVAIVYLVLYTTPIVFLLRTYRIFPTVYIVCACRVPPGQCVLVLLLCTFSAAHMYLRVTEYTVAPAAGATYYLPTTYHLLPTMELPTACSRSSHLHLFLLLLLLFFFGFLLFLRRRGAEVKATPLHRVAGVASGE